MTALTISLPEPTEKATQAAIVKLFRAAGCHVSSLSQYRRSKVALGLPDLYVQCPRRSTAWWFEVKRPGGKLRKEQEEFQIRCQQTDTRYYWGDLTAAIWVLESLGLVG